MGKVIEFYVPNNFRKPMKWVPEVQRGTFPSFAYRQESRPKVSGQFDRTSNK